MAIQEGLVNNKSVEIEYLVAAIYIFWIFHWWYFARSGLF
jgi:hypothetical protein